VERGGAVCAALSERSAWDTHSKNAESLKGLCQKTISRAPRSSKTETAGTARFDDCSLDGRSSAGCRFTGQDGRDHIATVFRYGSPAGLPPWYVHGIDRRLRYAAVSDSSPSTTCTPRAATLGLDHRQLAYPHDGRDTTLTDADVTGAEVMRQLVSSRLLAWETSKFAMPLGAGTFCMSGVDPAFRTPRESAMAAPCASPPRQVFLPQGFLLRAVARAI